MSRLYVGTYAKYSSGSIFGQWLELSDYSDVEEFMEACAVLHDDENDPEFMFQDFEGFPRAFYSECAIDPRLFDWLQLDEFQKECVEAYLENYGDHCTEDLDYMLDRVIKIADYGESDYMVAYGWCEELGVFDELPDHLRGYFDVESYFRDCGPSVVRTGSGVFGIID